jgi:hypothetical protein
MVLQEAINYDRDSYDYTSKIKEILDPLKYMT